MKKRRKVRVGGNLVARAIGVAQLNSIMRDFLIRMYFFEDGENVHERIGTLQLLVWMIITAMEIENRTSSPIYSQATSFILELEERSVAWKREYLQWVENNVDDILELSTSFTSVTMTKAAHLLNLKQAQHKNDLPVQK